MADLDDDDLDDEIEDDDFDEIEDDDFDDFDEDEDEDDDDGELEEDRAEAHTRDCLYPPEARWVVTAASGRRYEKCRCGFAQELPPVPPTVRGIETMNL